MKTVTALLILLLGWGLPALAGEAPWLVEADPPAASDPMGEDPDGGEPAALTFWCSPYPLEQGWAVQVTQAWNRLHPEARVRLQAMPPDRLPEEVLLEALGAGTAPDLTHHLFPVDVHEWAARGHLLPLDEHPALLEHLRARSGPEADGPFRSQDGRLYQLPAKCNPILLQFSPRLLERAGRRPPRAWSELRALAQALPPDRQGRRPWLWSPSPTANYWERYYDLLPLFLAASGGRGLLDEGGQLAPEDPAGVAVFELITDLFRQGACPSQPIHDPPGARNAAFLRGELALMLTGPWNAELLEEAGGPEASFDFAPLPAPDHHPEGAPIPTYGNFRSWGIFRGCRRPALAADFLRFATGPEHDLALLEATHQLPFRQGLTEEPRFVQALQRAHPALTRFALQRRWALPADPSPRLHEVLAILAEELHRAAVLGACAPSQAWAEAARRVREGGTRPAPPPG